VWYHILGQIVPPGQRRRPCGRGRRAAAIAGKNVQENPDLAVRVFQSTWPAG